MTYITLHYLLKKIDLEMLPHLKKKLGEILNQIFHCLSPRFQSAPPPRRPCYHHSSKPRVQIKQPEADHQRSNIYQFIKDRRFYYRPHPCNFELCCVQMFASICLLSKELCSINHQMNTVENRQMI